MSDPLFGLDSSKGLFQRYELPIHALGCIEAIHTNELHIHLVQEIIRRLSQLDRFYNNTWAWIHKSIELTPTSKEVTSDFSYATTHRAAMDTVADLAEAFYLFGHRVFDITRELWQRTKIPKPLPSMPKRFCNVRNHLIVHPERNFDKGQTVASWSFYVTNRDDRGVILKINRLPIESSGHTDPGLGPNALELQNYLERWIVDFHNYHS